MSSFYRFRFDIILDCTGRDNDFDSTLLKSGANAKYLTLASPLLHNFDNYGMIGGLFKTIWDFLAVNAWSIFKLKTIRWVLFQPNQVALLKMRDFAQQEKVRISTK